MKLAIIFVLAILVVGQEAWAKDDPQVLTLTHKEQLEKSKAVETQMLERDMQMVRLVSDVTNFRVAVKPSMVPPEIFDRIYLTETWNREILASGWKDVDAMVSKDTAKEMFYVGQMAAMRDLLYIVGVLPATIYSLNLLFNDSSKMTAEEAIKEARSIQIATRADRMRLVTAMLLLLNYKESNPVPPGNMVQVTAIK